MTAERYQRINQLADAVLEIPPDARDAYLTEACSVDSELRQEVELLVKAHESSGEFLEQPAFERMAQELARASGSVSLEGREIGRYRVLSRLGAGGHGEVWLAEDTQLSRKVAIKLLSADWGAHSDRVQRLYAEARICSALNHPNIVTIYDTGEVEGAALLAQEYVEGETLRRMLARGPLAAETALSIVRQVAAALGAAHAAGVIHRDIKPENIMVRRDGLVKVLDFGLAQFAESGSGDGAAHGVLMGTVKYMSPEQAQGLPLDARTDVFSLGVVFFEMLSGRNPFGAPTASETLATIRDGEADLGEVPSRFRAVVRKCLAREREGRYATAGALREELERSGKRWSGVRRASLAAALVVLTAAGFFAYRNRSAPAPFQSMKISLVSTAGVTLAGAISPDGKRVAYVLQEEPGQSLWVRPADSTEDTRLLQAEPGAHRHLTFSPDGAYLYYEWSAAEGGSALWRIAAKGGGTQTVFENVSDSFSISPDGRRVAFIRLDEQRWEESVMVASLEHGDERRVAVRRRPRYFSRAGLAWSPDGKSLMCLAGNAPFYTADAYRLVRLDVATGAETPVGKHTWAWANSLLWSPDGHGLIVGANDHGIGSLQVWHVSWPGGETRRITNDLSSYENLSQSADGESLLAVRHDRIFDLGTEVLGDAATDARVLSRDVHDLTSAAWDADGHILYTALGGSAVNVWRVDAKGTNRKQITSAALDQDEVEVSPDGRVIFFSSGGRIWRVNGDGSGARPLTPGPLDVHPAITPDGKWVLYAAFAGWSPGIGGQPSLWKIPVDGGYAVQLTREATSSPSVSPDGKRFSCVYFMDQPGGSPRTAIYAIEGGAPIQIFERPAGTEEDRPYWTPDGKAVEYLVVDAAGSRIVRRMLGGGRPSVVASFPGEHLFFVRPSIDGRSIAFARGKETRELVMLRDVHEGSAESRP